MKNITIFNPNSIPLQEIPQNSLLLSDIQKLASVLKGTDRVLLKIATVFPFDFFPDEITVDEYKVNIVFHEFFLSEDIHSITIDMIKDIEVDTGPIFATLKIVPDGYPGHALEIQYLKKKDAIKAGRLIQGLIVARKNGIDPVKLNQISFITDIEALGNTHLIKS